MMADEHVQHSLIISKLYYLSRFYYVVACHCHRCRCVGVSVSVSPRLNATDICRVRFEFAIYGGACASKSQNIINLCVRMNMSNIAYLHVARANDLVAAAADFLFIFVPSDIYLSSAKYVHIFTVCYFIIIITIIDCNQVNSPFRMMHISLDCGSVNAHLCKEEKRPCSMHCSQLVCMLYASHIIEMQRDVCDQRKKPMGTRNVLSVPSARTHSSKP